MKQSLSDSRIAFATVVLALAAGFAAPRANADEWNKRTVLTVNQTIQVRDAVLEPGQYVLQLLNSSSDRHVVQIFNGDQSHIIATVLAIPKERTEPTGDTRFAFWETPPGTAKALRAWFYPGDTIGQEFPYPKHPHLLAMVEPPAPSTAETQPAPAPAAPPETATTTPPAEQQPAPDTNMAEAAPPPTPEPPPPAAEQTPPPTPPNRPILLLRKSHPRCQRPPAHIPCWGPQVQSYSRLPACFA